MKTKFALACYWLLALCLVWLAGCSSTGHVSGGLSLPLPAGGIVGSTTQSYAENSRRATESAANEAPGLGTAWGETRQSQVRMVNFARASGRPFAVGKLFYDNLAGISQMRGGSVFPRDGGLQPVGRGAVSVGVRGSDGTWLDETTVDGRRFVVGQSGRAYSIVVRNHTPDRLEIVLSVDGLDVLDGMPASLKKTGYIVPGGQTLVVAGFRQSLDKVASFRFSKLEDSYASQKHGDTANTGLIGVAVFHEKGSRTDRWPQVYTHRRLGADPFPGGSSFATPP